MPFSPGLLYTLQPLWQRDPFVQSSWSPRGPQCNRREEGEQTEQEEDVIGGIQALSDAGSRPRETFGLVLCSERKKFRPYAEASVILCGSTTPAAKGLRTSQRTFETHQKVVKTKTSVHHHGPGWVHASGREEVLLRRIHLNGIHATTHGQRW